jgi:hypothetical protein
MYGFLIHITKIQKQPGETIYKGKFL